MIDDVAKTVSEFMKGYKEQHADNKEGAPKVLFVIDSLGMLLTPTDVDQFEKGEMKGDLGRKPKALTALVIAMKKLKLKEDEKGNKISDVRGIRAACKVMKTRYAKPFESVQVKIPYDTGMDPYSGLVDLFEKKGILVQTGNRLKYIDSAGKEHLEFRKAWVGDKLDMLMQDFDKLAVDQPKEK